LDHTSNARGGDEVLGTLRAIDDLSVIADEVVKTHDGFVPATEADLLSLPRVGVYLASTVLVYGHQLTAAILDRSTARVARRIRGGQHQAGNWQARLDLEKLAGHDGPDAAFNAAISDLANLVCRAADPQCGACPVRAHCAVGRQFVSG
jgi:A/G-specific adenine glycosylase